MRLTITVLICVVGMTMIAGCGGENPFDPDKPRRGPAMGAGGQLAPADLPGQEGNRAGKEAKGPDKKLPPPPPTTSPTGNSGKLPPPPPPASTPANNPSGTAEKPDPNVVRTAARPGVTGKGRGYGRGPIQTPVRAYFITKERLVFEIQIPQAMNLYRAMRGYYPKSQEEFDKQIIEANHITLPKLSSPDERYVYLPEKAAKMKTYDTADPPLVVERPR